MIRRRNSLLALCLILALAAPTALLTTGAGASDTASVAKKKKKKCKKGYKRKTVGRGKKKRRVCKKVKTTPGPTAPTGAPAITVSSVSLSMANQYAGTKMRIQGTVTLSAPKAQLLNGTVTFTYPSGSPTTEPTSIYTDPNIAATHFDVQVPYPAASPNGVSVTFGGVTSASISPSA
ncbi:MAG: hypothetical protein ACRDKI_08195 [Solirubrobacterales bacterium]